MSCRTIGLLTGVTLVITIITFMDDFVNFSSISYNLYQNTSNEYNNSINNSSFILCRYKVTADLKKQYINETVPTIQVFNQSDHSTWPKDWVSQWNNNITLPYFTSMSQLVEYPEWFRYLNAVYDQRTLKFPLDVRNFTFFWTALMPEYLKRQLYLLNPAIGKNICEHKRIDPNVHTMTFGKPYCYGYLEALPAVWIHIFGSMTNGHDCHHSSKGKCTPGPYMRLHPYGITENTWIEVMHQCCDDFGQGLWMFVAIGSGIFYNTGRTLNATSHGDSCRRFNGSDSKCTGYYRANVWSAFSIRKHGFDSIQYPDSAPGGTTSQIEIQDLRSSYFPPETPQFSMNRAILWDERKLKTHLNAFHKSVSHEGVCSRAPYAFRSGWSASKSCNCMTSAVAKGQHINCGRYWEIIPIDKQSPFSNTLMIVTTSDVHGYISNMARLKTFVSNIRESNENTLVVDAGDAFIGSSYFNKYGASGIASLMSEIGYHAMALGNHDIERLNDLPQFTKEAKMPVLSINVRAPGVQKSMYVDLKSVRVGVIGYTLVDVPVLVPGYKEAGYTTLLQDISDEAHFLRLKMNCTHIVLLGHGSMDTSTRLSASLRGLVDAVIGGHAHTYYHKAVYTSDEPVLIYTGHSLSHVGTLLLKFYKNLRSAGAVGNLIDLNTITPNVTMDSHVRKAINNIEIGQPVAIMESSNHTNMVLSHSHTCRTSSCAIGDIVADSMRWNFACRLVANQLPIIALREAGSIRSSLNGGVISISNIDQILPWNNELILLELFVSDILLLLKYSYSQQKNTIGGSGSTLSLSGIYYNHSNITFDCLSAKSVCYHSRQNLSHKPNSTCLRALLLTDRIMVVMTKWMATGGDGYPPLMQLHKTLLRGDFEVSALIQYLQGSCHLNSSKSNWIPPPVQLSSTNDALIEAIGGAFGAIIACFITYPLILRQAQQIATVVDNESVIFSKYCYEMFSINESCHSSRLLATFAVFASTFVFWVVFHTIEPLVSHQFVASIVAAIVNVFATNPLWVIVTRMQIRYNNDRNTVEETSNEAMVGENCMHEYDGLKESDGYCGFFRGVLPNLLMICYPSIQTTSFFSLMSLARTYMKLSERREMQIQYPWLSFCLGLASASIATTITYPVQVARIRLQASLPLCPDSYHQWFSGFQMKLLHSCITGAFMFFCKEQFVAIVSA